MVLEDDVLPRETDSPFLSTLIHAGRTTQQTLLAIYSASQQKTKKLCFSSQVRKEQNSNFKRFHLSHYAVVCEVINLWIAMFENSAKISFFKNRSLQSLKTFAWFNPSIKSYLLMASSLILLRSLLVYILKQLFQSPWIVALGIFTSPLLASLNYNHYSPRF